MTKLDYAALRLDPKWQKRRLEIMQRDGFKCVDCERDDRTLNVHHAYYVTGRMPWQYPSFALATLCAKCHKARHGELAEDEEFGFYEWEQELEWLLRGDANLAGAMWGMAAELAQWCEGYPTVAAYDDIRKYIQSQIRGVKF